MSCRRHTDVHMNIPMYILVHTRTGSHVCRSSACLSICTEYTCYLIFVSLFMSAMCCGCCCCFCFCCWYMNINAVYLCLPFSAPPAPPPCVPVCACVARVYMHECVSLLLCVLVCLLLVDIVALACCFARMNFLLWLGSFTPANQCCAPGVFAISICTQTNLQKSQTCACHHHHPYAAHRPTSLPRPQPAH